MVVVGIDRSSDGVDVLRESQSRKSGKRKQNRPEPGHILILPAPSSLGNNASAAPPVACSSATAS